MVICLCRGLMARTDFA